MPSSGCGWDYTSENRSTVRMFLLLKNTHHRLPLLCFARKGNYAERLAKVVKKIIILCEIAVVARTSAAKARDDEKLHQRTLSYLSEFGMTKDDLRTMLRCTSSDTSGARTNGHRSSNHDSESTADDQATRQALSQSQEWRMNELLDRWYVKSLSQD